MAGFSRKARWVNPPRAGLLDEDSAPSRGPSQRKASGWGYASSMFIAPVRALVNFARHEDCSEIRRCRLESGGLLAQRDKIRAL
jgi:hypothetical protein